MKGFVRRNGLLLVSFVLFFGTFFVGQTITGHHVYNEDQKEHGESGVTMQEYVTTGHFLEATMENWESEFLQMGAYILLTVWFRQKGSAESKKLDQEEAVERDPLDDVRADSPWPVRRGKGLALSLYKNSLSLAFLGLFAIAFVLHLLGGAREFSQEQQAHGGAPVSPSEFLGTADFWFQSLQNWQSEFLAVAAIVFLSIYLRQQGSPESKPVAAPHSETGS
ncbi:MAG TPA: DUF6766 family protein [Acidimicrobiales bacterium]|nr:DUF6766 family protein [Acidimicrobiales bacterium]